MSLRVPNINKVNPNADEILLVEAYSLAQIEIDKLIILGIKADDYGRKNAQNYYKAVSYYYFLITYCLIGRHKLDKQGLLNTPCNGKIIQNDLNIDCVLDSLLCIQKRLDVDYRGYLLKLFSLFGISYDKQNCIPQCQGIGSFMLDQGDDLSSWIIGDCDEVNNLLNGEFTPGEFNLSNFIKPLT